MQGGFLLPVVHAPSEPVLYEYVKDRNLQSQWFLLETLVNYSLKCKRYSFSIDTLLALHHSSSVYLDDMPGKLRVTQNHIQNSKHTTPDPHDVSNLLFEYVSYLNRNFAEHRPTQLAAFALWRLTWIHPFNECNGRTARAFAYLVLCAKIGAWLPGKKTIHELIRRNERDYYDSLERADAAFAENGVFNVDQLEEFVKRILFNQIESVPENGQ